MLIGQKTTQETIKVLIQASLKERKPFPHSLFIGPSGFGKTSFAKLVAKELKRTFFEYNAASIKDSINLAFALRNIDENDIVFIDEIHRMNTKAQEAFYTIMEGNYLNVMAGSESIDKIDIQSFTLLGATTSTVSGPMLGRFRHVFRMEDYTESEIGEIARNNDARFDVAKYCRGIPRNAVKYTEWLKDYFSVKGEPVTKSNIAKAMEQIGIYQDGLTVEDLIYLNFLNKQNRLVGIRTIAHATGLDEKHIREDIEPHLLKHGYILRAPRGRMVNRRELKKLGL